MAWWELLGMLGGAVDAGAAVSVQQQSLSELLGAHFEFANKTIPNSDQMGLPADYISAADAAQMGAVLVAQKVAQPVTPVTVETTTSNVGDTTSIVGQIPLPPVVSFFSDPDDPTLFASAPKSIIYHAQIGVVPRLEDFSWISSATEYRIQRFLGHEENVSIVKDWSALGDRHWTGIVWDFYLRTGLTIRYRIQFRNASSTTEWSAWNS
jgi:hypothetical protein